MSFSIYLHIPFCEVKCGYCDFFSVPRGHGDFDLQKEYVDAMIREIEARAPSLTGRRPISIFFGGGTPSLLDPRLLEKILKKLATYFSWGEATEITLEANPKTVSLERLRDFKKLGMNRLSVGVQSLTDSFLKVLGRIHSADEARVTIADARAAGFENFSIDLIFALPGQTLEDWKRDLEEALAFGTPHLSAYHLMIEEGTSFAGLYAQKKLPLPDDDLSCAMLEWTYERVAESGRSFYEISNFARPGFESIHNQNYWRYGEYVGFGAGACSFLGKIRRSNRRDLTGYLKNPAACYDEETIDRRKGMGEYGMLGLRLRSGIEEDDFECRFGLSFRNAFGPAIEKAEARGWLEQKNRRWWLTKQGILFSNELFAELI